MDNNLLQNNSNSSKNSFTDNDLAAWKRGTASYLQVASGANKYKELIDDPAFVALLGDIEGKDILDIGCGDGTFCRTMKQAGARVVGLDATPQMLSIARHNDPDGVYVLADITKPLPSLPIAQFDIVTAKLMLMNVTPLTAIAKQVHTLLRGGGMFAVDIVHPFRPFINTLTENRPHYDPINDYFHEVRGTMEFNGERFPYYYRPVGQYLRDITLAGFTFVEMRELHASKAFGQQYPSHSRKIGQPVTMHLLFARQDKTN